MPAAKETISEMKNDLINILPNSNKDIDNQKLMDYLSNNMSIEEKHEIEKVMADSALINDAVEGLQHFENKQSISAFAAQLNAELHKHLKKKKQHRQKLKLKEHPWLYVTAILILTLLVIGFVVISKHLQI